MQQDWITLSTLSTFGGAVFAVTLITQFLKGSLDRLFKARTRLLVLTVAWLVLMGRQMVASGGLSFEGVFFDLLNAFLVALAAMGAHSMAKDNIGWK